MPADEQPNEQHRRRSTSKKVKYYTKYCVLVLICCLSIVIIPGIYLMYALNTNSLDNTRNEDYEKKFGGKAAEGPLPWYMDEGVVYPRAKDEGEELKIWPEEENSDRIENQLMLVSKVNTTSLVKTILMYNDLPTLNLVTGQDSFLNCPVESCTLSTNVDDIVTADAVLFSDEQYVLPTMQNGRPPQQVWVLFLTKNPYRTHELTYPAGSINWTASYRSDSDIVTPIHKWVYYNQTLEERPELSRNFAARKTKKVVWFVRDFGHEHSGRREYAEELQKYIDVDVFSSSRCPCSSPEHCVRLLKQYKFFLAFETCHCRDYITQKFFTSLRHGVLPVVMGPPAADYERSAPRDSYVHVDEFPSPRLLAQHLHELDRHDDLYNAYFRWRGTGEMIDTRVGCRLCALLHTSGRNKTYSDVNSWWTDNACTTQ